MDANETDAVDLVTLNGFLVNGVVPTAQEGIDISSCLLQELAHVVVEGADVCALVLEFLEVKEREEPFGQVHQRKCKQPLVERDFNIGIPVNALVGLNKICLAEIIFRMYQGMKGLDKG